MHVMLRLAMVPIVALLMASFIDLYVRGEATCFLVPLLYMIAIGAICGFWFMSYRITDNGVDAYYFPVRYEVRYDQIKKIKADSEIPWFYGVGLRVFKDGICFNTRWRKLVEIERTDGFFKKFYLSPRDPEKFVEIVKANMKAPKSVKRKK